MFFFCYSQLWNRDRPLKIVYIEICGSSTKKSWYFNYMMEDYDLWFFSLNYSKLNKYRWMKIVKQKCSHLLRNGKKKIALNWRSGRLVSSRCLFFALLCADSRGERKRDEEDGFVATDSVQKLEIWFTRFPHSSKLVLYYRFWFLPTRFLSFFHW